MSANDVSDEKLASLERDGISEDLFKLLWAKDELNYGPSINVPDTIIYKYGSPVCWYFTANNGKIKKKHKQNLVSAKIEEQFNKHVLGYDVLAMFISMPVEHDLENQGTNVIEYLDRNALNDFLYNRKKEVNGILQRFIEPKSTRNEVVRAIWSPKVCLLERAENIHQLHDHRYGLYERCVIYEGPEYYTTSAPLRGPVLSGQLQKLCETVVSHISEVTYGQKQVSRIVINFKVDSRDKIWLLYSTSIRCIDMLEYTNPTDASMTLQRHLVNIDSVVSLSNTVHLNPNKTYEKIVPKRRIRCLSCANETLEDRRHPVTYKGVIKHYEHVMHLLAETSSPSLDPNKNDRMIQWPPDSTIVEAAGGVGFGCLYITDVGEMMTPSQIAHYTKPRYLKDLQIPPILHNIHYKLSLKSFERCKFDPLFLYKTVHVCEACYLVYAEFTMMLLRMGQDLTKLLTPDPAAAPVLDRSSTLDRPSSADWRAISTAQASSVLNKSQSLDSSGFVRTAEFKPSANHRHALDSAIGIRSSDTRQQPVVPSNLRDPGASASAVNSMAYNSQFSHTQSHISHEQPSMASTTGGRSKSPVKGGNALEYGSASVQSGTARYDADEVRNAIAERERHFFKEVSLNPNLKDQHPLMHLISAQQKLKLIDQQSGVLTSKSANKSESIFGTRYGKQSGDQFNRNGAYAVEIPYALNGEIVLPSVLRQRKKDEARKTKMKKSESFKSMMSGDGDLLVADAPAGSASASATSVSGSMASDPNTQASKKHRDFLAESLRRIEGNVGDAEPYSGHYTGRVDDKLATTAASNAASKKSSLKGLSPTKNAGLTSERSSRAATAATVAGSPSKDAEDVAPSF